MSKIIYIYSTLAADVTYTNHTAGGADIPLPIPNPTDPSRVGVLVKGGAGVANDRLITPRGAVTPISEIELEYLTQNPVFQKHRENGFVEFSEESVDPDKAAADMAGRDISAPLVPQDLKPEEKPAAVGGELEAEDDETPPPPRGAKRGKRG